jgi:hypothetical protein
MSNSINASASPSTPDYSNVATSFVAQALAGQVALDRPEPRSVADQIADHVGTLTPLDAAALMDTVRCVLAAAAAECAMAEPSRLVLGGFALRKDAQIVRLSARDVDKLGVTIGSRVMKPGHEFGSGTA